MDPEKAHLILNHLPLFGIMASLIPAAVGYFSNCRTTLITGLAMLALFSFSVVLVMNSGEGAYERFEGPLEHLLDKSGKIALEEHEERAETFSVVVYLSGALNLLALIAAFRTHRFTRTLTAVGIGFALLSLASLAWIGKSGGEIRHIEVRKTVQAPQR